MYLLERRQREKMSDWYLEYIYPKKKKPTTTMFHFWILLSRLFHSLWSFGRLSWDRQLGHWPCSQPNMDLEKVAPVPSSCDLWPLLWSLQQDTHIFTLEFDRFKDNSVQVWRFRALRLRKKRAGWVRAISSPEELCLFPAACVFQEMQYKLLSLDVALLPGLAVC